MKARMVQHFKTDGHLSDECYDNVRSVFYCSFKTKVEMDIYELYYIDKYRPQYNTMLIHDNDEQSSLILHDVVWKQYIDEVLKIG